MSILICVAHPDDETLGCGGTLFGSGALVATFTDGVGARCGPEADAVARAESLLKACDVLGLEVVEAHASFPDNELDIVPMLDLARRVEQLIGSDVTTIYTHHPGDLNVDHRRVAEAVLVATRPGGRYPVREVYAMEIPSSTEWTFGQIAPAFLPNVFVNITQSLETKLEAFACYDDELRESPHPRALSSLVHHAASWGAVAGCAYAEAFQLIRSLR